MFDQIGEAFEIIVGEALDGKFSIRIAYSQAYPSISQVNTEYSHRKLSFLLDNFSDFPDGFFQLCGVLPAGLRYFWPSTTSASGYASYLFYNITGMESSFYQV